MWTSDVDLRPRPAICRTQVMQAQWALQAQCEANPQDWMLSGVAPKLRKVRRRVAAYVHCDHQDLVRGCSAPPPARSWLL
jgi:hypothetical protein